MKNWSGCSPLSVHPADEASPAAVQKLVADPFAHQLHPETAVHSEHLVYCGQFCAKATANNAMNKTAFIVNK